jgi:hypothetical protein
MEETDNKPEDKTEEEVASSPKATTQDGVEIPSEAGEATPATVSMEQRTFPGEVSMTFQEALERIPMKGYGGARILTLLMQPVLGALPNQVKKDLEATVENRIVFSAATATGLNILLNLFSYPVLLMLVAIGLNGLDVVFSQKINGFVLLGISLGFLEGFYRIKEGILHARPVEEMILRGSFYGGPLSVLAPWFAGGPKLLRDIPVPVEGFYGKGFVDKLERERRYGHAYTIEDLGLAYHLKLEFPRRVPEIVLLEHSDLPSEMPDYDFDLSLKDGHFIVKGKLTDQRVRRFCGNVGAFPGEFTTVIPLEETVEGFSHRFENKLLEVLLLKGKANGESVGAEQN